MEEDSAETFATSLRHDTIIKQQSAAHLPVKPTSKSSVKFIILLLISLVFAMTAYLLDQVNDSNGLGLSLDVIKFTVYSLYSLSISVIIYLVTVVLVLVLNKKTVGGTFISGLLKEHSYSISASLALIIVAQMIKLKTAIKPDIENKIEITKIEDAILAGKIKEMLGSNLSGFFMGVGMVVGIFFVKNLVMYGLNFNLYFNYYHYRIEENNEKFLLLKTLNELVSAGNEEDIELICTRIVQVLAKDRPFVEISDIRRALGEEFALKITKYADLNNSNTLTVDELKSFYATTLNEQQQISLGLQQKNSSVKNLNFMFTLLCIPFAISSFVACITPNSNLVGYNAVFMSSIISTSWIFSDTIKKFLSSIIFIFFVRPFEIDDYVIINNKLYKIKEINVLATIMQDHMLHVTYPNDGLLNAVITNLRCSRSCDEHYTFEFETKSFKEKKDNLIKAINTYIKKTPKVFKRTVMIRDVRQLTAKSVKVTIVLCFNYDNMEMKTIGENKDKASLKLSEILEDVGLTPISIK